MKVKRCYYYYFEDKSLIFLKIKYSNENRKQPLTCNVNFKVNVTNRWENVCNIQAHKLKLTNKIELCA